MITNERQYRITRSELEGLRNLLTELDGKKSPDADDFDDLHRKGLASQVEEFSLDIAEYEELTEKKSRVIETDNLSELPDALIRARIARGLTQKQLAEKLGTKEQQVQRWEASSYETASLANLNRVIAALNVRVRDEIFIPKNDVTGTALVARLKTIGFPKRLLVDRLLPPDFLGVFSKDGSPPAEGTVFKVAAKIGRIFNISLRHMLGDEPGDFNFFPIYAARFKVSANANLEALNVYTLYAHYLAALTAQITSHIPQSKLTSNWETTRARILKRSVRVDFKSAIHLAWECGVAVLPLDDHGAFHGAVWRINGRNVIVLKQRKDFASVWLHDLLHELLHAAEEPTEKSFSLVESAPISEERRESASEQRANDFAEDVVFGNRSDEIEDACVVDAGKSVPRLKTAIPRIAERFNVDQGYLANYMAHVLDEHNGINFWGAATNLQEDDYSPFEYAREVFFTKVSMGRLNEVDREILMQGLRGGVESHA